MAGMVVRQVFLLVALGLWGRCYSSTFGSGGEVPRSWRETAVEHAPVEVLPDLDAYQEAEQHEGDKGMLKIAKAAQLPTDEGFSMETDGDWTRLDGSGGIIWRLNIYSPGALSQTLLFSKLRLPPGSDLFMYSPFLTRNSSVCFWGCLRLTPRDVPLTRKMVTHPLPGPLVAIEYFHPMVNASKWPAELQISQVLQGFRRLDSLTLTRPQWGHGWHVSSTPTSSHSTAIPPTRFLRSDDTAPAPDGAPQDSPSGTQDSTQDSNDLYSMAQGVTGAASVDPENLNALLDQMLNELSTYFDEYGGSTPFSYDPTVDGETGAGAGRNPGNPPPDGGYEFGYGDVWGGVTNAGSAGANGVDELSKDPGYSYDDLETSVLNNVGAAKKCMSDVLCNSSLAEVANGVVMIIAFNHDYAGVCTGNLINTVDQKQYLLTAYHCLNDGSSKPVEDTTWTYYWTAVFQHQQPCGSTDRINHVKMLTGMNYVWGDVDIDMLLLEIMDDIPDDFNAYYMGWTSEWDYVPQETACVQHPRGDLKKFAYDGEHPKSIRVTPEKNGDMEFSALNATHWEIVSWNSGATSAGSSGSVLLDAGSQLLVGTLTGGMSDCGNTQPDVFSKLSVAWRYYGLWTHLNGSSAAEGMEIPARNHSTHRMSLLSNPNGLVMKEASHKPIPLIIGLLGEFQADEVVSISLDVKSEKEGEAVTLSTTLLELSADHTQETVHVTPVDDNVSEGSYTYFDIVLTAQSSVDDTFLVKRSIPGTIVDDELPPGESQGYAINITSIPFQHTVSDIALYKSKPDLTLSEAGLGADIVFVVRPDSSVKVDITTCPDASFDSYLEVMEGQNTVWSNDDESLEVSCSTLKGLQLQGGSSYWVVVAVVNPNLIHNGAFTLRVTESK